MADGGLHFVATQDNKQVLVSLEQMRQEFARMAENAQNSGQSMDATFDNLKSKIMGVAGGMASLATAMELSKKVATVRGEFQQLEIAFGTMLGSAEKANKLMTQLTATAAKTPFDLKGVANGAKQLLAYGIAADEVNDTLVHLGDIAAGLSIPLNDMVTLYGTTMVQGRMFTQDLRQFQGRGIPIMEALANTMGVTKDAVGDLVSTGKVGAQEFQQALMSLTAEGGKFGGLMDKQSQSISGQISNIEDGIDMMFNEIGQKSEGAINLALSGVGTLVENYETVGKAILAFAGTYGTYRAALVIVSATEKAHQAVVAKSIAVKRAAALANVTMAESDAMSAARKVLFTQAIKANTKALWSNTVAMLSNPAVAITAGIVALCAAVWALSKALNTEAKAQERVNAARQAQKDQMDETKNQADEALSTLQSETATAYEKAKAYETLKKIMPELTEQYSQQELATMGLEKAQKAEAKALENLDFATKAKEIEKSEKKIESLEAQLEQMMKMPSQSGMAMGMVANRLETERKVLAELKKDYREADKLRKQAQFDAMTVEQKVEFYTTEKESAEARLNTFLEQAKTKTEEMKKAWEADPNNQLKIMQGVTFEQVLEQNPIEAVLAAAKQEWESKPENQFKINMGITFEQDMKENPMQAITSQWGMLYNAISSAQGEILKADSSIQALEQTSTKETLPQLIKNIDELEKKLAEARKAYANDMSDANKQALDTVEEDLKKAKDKYTLATGKTWDNVKKTRQDAAKEAKKLLEDELRAVQQAQNERQRILNSSIQNERARREAAYWQTIREINQEEAAYKKAHKGKTSKEFGERRKNAALQFDLDTKALDKQFADWKKDLERQTLQIKIDSRTQELERAVDNANNITQRIQRQNELYAQQVELLKEENKLERDRTLSDKYGEKTLADFRVFSANENNKAVISLYQQAKTPEERKNVARNVNLDESLLATYSEMQQIYDAYVQRLDATMQQAAQSHNAEMLKQDIDDYTAYCDEILQAAQEREEALAAIESGEETNRTKEMVEADFQAKVKKSKQDHSIDETEQEAADLVARLVQSLADVTYDQVEIASKEFMDAINEDIEALQSQIDSKKAEAQTEQQNIDQLNTQMEDPLLTDQQRLALTQQIAEAEARLAAIKAQEAGLDNNMTKLLQTRRTMEDTVASTKQKSGKKTVKQMETEQRVTGKVVDALGEVSNAAKAVANTMGGVLSKKSKKALGVIADVADFGIQSIQSIQYVATNASTLMESTAIGAAGAIQTVEKASVILTIISLAVQAIMAIVNIAKQFTQNAKVNEELDDMAANIERLKEQQRDLEFQIRNSKGSQYFVDQARAAQNMTKQINAQKEAYEKSLKEEQRLAKKYGEDSDKAGDQHERTQEFLEGYQDAVQETEDMWQELVDTILTTDLSGWADSLADSAIEAAMDGSKAFSEIWNEALEQWERDMYKQQLKLAYENLFKDSFERFSAKAQEVATAGGELSEADIDQFVAEMEAKQDEAERITEMYRELMEKRGLLTDEGDVEGSKGGFQNMSQDTADELNARFTALQIEGANVVTTSQAMQAMLESIADNDRLRLASIQSMASNIDIGVTIQQNMLDQTRMIAETVGEIKKDTERLRAIEQNTDRL